MLVPLEGSFDLMLRLGVERRGEDERDRQERRAGLCAARLELGSTGRAGDKRVLREVSTECNTWGSPGDKRSKLESPGGDQS